MSEANNEKNIGIGTASLAALVLLGLVVSGYEASRLASSGGSALSPLTANGFFNLQTAYLLPLSEPNPFPLRLAGSQEPNLTAKTVLLFDTNNRHIIYSSHSNQALPIASLTKILTAMVVLDQLAVPLPTLNLPSGNAETAADEAAGTAGRKTSTKMSGLDGGTRMGEESGSTRRSMLGLGRLVTLQANQLNHDGTGADFPVGATFSVGDLLRVMLVKSSNDAAYALAAETEIASGQSFATLMQEKAEQLGLHNSHWLDPAGLNDDAYASADDLLKIVISSKNYPAIWQALRLAEVNLIDTRGRGYHFTSTDKLFGDPESAGWQIVGGKTGYTDGARGCLILEIALPDQYTTLLAIVLGAEDRFAETKHLIEWAKVSFRWK